jgi:hypothetical protein
VLFWGPYTGAVPASSQRPSLYRSAVQGPAPWRAAHACREGDKGETRPSNAQETLALCTSWSFSQIQVRQPALANSRTLKHQRPSGPDLHGIERRASQRDDRLALRLPVRQDQGLRRRQGLEGPQCRCQPKPTSNQCHLDPPRTLWRWSVGLTVAALAGDLARAHVQVLPYEQHHFEGQRFAPDTPRHALAGHNTRPVVFTISIGPSAYEVSLAVQVMGGQGYQ